MIVPNENPSFFVARTAPVASFLPSVFGSAGAVSSRSKRPLNSTKNPKPFEVKTSRLPSHVFEVSFGGVLSQYPENEKVCRKSLRARSPGYLFLSKPLYVREMAFGGLGT